MRFYAWLLVRIGIAVVLVGWAYFALVPDRSGREEFQRSIEAMKSVHSLHYTVSASVPTQQTEIEGDLDCSSGRTHRKSHISLHQPHNEGTVDEEVLGDGDQEYRLMKNGQWKRDISVLGSARTICQRLAQGADTWVTRDLSDALQHDVIEKGNKKTVNGEVCREWKISNARYSFRNATICIGTKSHLPLEQVVTGSNSLSIYSYNTPIQIDPPTNIMPEPKYDDYQPPAPGLTLSDDKDDIH